MTQPQILAEARPNTNQNKTYWGAGVFFFLVGMLCGSFAGMQMLEDVIRRARTGQLPDGPILTTVLVLFFSIFALIAFGGATMVCLHLRETFRPSHQ